MASKSSTVAENSEFSVEQKIDFLYKLQQIDSQIDSINHIKGELPLEVADLEDVVAGLEKRIDTASKEADEISANIKNCKENIENSKKNIAKYELQQKEVRNNREFESLNKEIEYQGLEIELAEKHNKEYSAELKIKKRIIEETKEVLSGRSVDLNNKKEELANIEAETNKEIEELTASATAQAENIDEHLLEVYHKIRGNVRNGLAVVTVRRDACGGCFNRIPPQRQIEINLSKKIVVCEYCGRILISEGGFEE